MLIFSMSASVDGFIADREGAFGWTAPSEEQFRFNIAQQSGQRRYMRRCSLTSTAISGSSATWWRAGSPVGSRSSAWNR